MLAGRAHHEPAIGKYLEPDGQVPKVRNFGLHGRGVTEKQARRRVHGQGQTRVTIADASDERGKRKHATMLGRSRRFRSQPIAGSLVLLRGQRVKQVRVPLRHFAAGEIDVLPPLLMGKSEAGRREAGDQTEYGQDCDRLHHVTPQH